MSLEPGIWDPESETEDTGTIMCRRHCKGVGCDVCGVVRRRRAPQKRAAPPPKALPGADMSISFAGVEFKNPVVTTSGAFGFGREYGRFYDLSELGGISVRGLTLRPSEGNKPARIAETALGVLSSVGLQNPGVEAFIKDELPFLRGFRTVVIANISGNAMEEYALMAGMLSEAKVDMIELNLSCRNAGAGGMLFCDTAASVAAVTEVVKKRAGVPIIVKLPPNVPDLTGIAKAAESTGADAVSLIGALPGMRIDTLTRKPVLRSNVGGLSGPAVFPVALMMVWQVSSVVGIPVLGMGGVASGNDAVEMMLAGASLVGVGTACLSDPFAPIGVRKGIEEYLSSSGTGAARELIGKVALN